MYIDAYNVADVARSGDPLQVALFLEQHKNASDIEHIAAIVAAFGDELVVSTFLSICEGISPSIVSAMINQTIVADNIAPTDVLLAHEFDVDYVNDNGESLLIQSVEHARYDMVKVLVDRGANLDFKNASGHTALFIAQVYDYQRIEKYLLQAGATTNLCSF